VSGRRELAPVVVAVGDRTGTGRSGAGHGTALLQLPPEGRRIEGLRPDRR